MLHIVPLVNTFFYVYTTVPLEESVWNIMHLCFVLYFVKAACDVFDPSQSPSRTLRPAEIIWYICLILLLNVSNNIVCFLCFHWTATQGRYLSPFSEPNDARRLDVKS